jgi:hypothetical protein
MNAVIYRQHRGRFGLVSREGVDHQREPRGVGEQPDGDLRVRPPLFGEPWFAEPIGSIGLEIQRAHVVEHQAGRAQASTRRAGGRQRLPPLVGREHWQATVHRPIRRRADARFGQHPQAVHLARRLDNPGQHQGPEHLVPIGGRIEPQHLVRAGQRIPQVPHPRRRDRKRATTVSTGIQAQIELALTRDQALSRRSLKDLKLSIVVRRTDVLDIPRPTPRGMHDLHRRGP